MHLQPAGQATAQGRSVAKLLCSATHMPVEIDLHAMLVE